MRSSPIPPAPPSSPAPSFPGRRTLVVAVIAVVVVLVVVAATVAVLAWVRATSYDDATRAAQRYVDLLASGDGSDLARLAEGSAASTPALADAARLLAGADERIEVVAVGEAEEVDSGVDLPAEVRSLADLAQVEVRYRLGEDEHSWSLVLGREGDRWLVAVPMTGSVAWDEPAVQRVDSDIRLGDTVLERRPRSGGGGDDGDDDGAGDGAGDRDDDEVQPLYPAVYTAQKQIDPWFTSEPEQVTVLPGEPTAQPALTLSPTAATRDRIVAAFGDRADSCGGPDAFATCPFYDLVATVEAGGDPSAEGWWLGLVGKPDLSVGTDGVKVSGAFAYVGSDGRRTMRFTGRGEIALPTATRGPTLSGLEIKQEP